VIVRDALILSAGLGTRLRPLTDARAKPAMPVAGEPLIRRIIVWLAAHDVTDIVVNLHHRPETLSAILGEGRDLNVRVRYSWEQPRVLGSAGGPRQALPLIDADTFIIVNGDTLTDVDVRAVIASHQQSQARVTLALVPNREYLRYGGVHVDDAGAVTGFSPPGDASKGSSHFIGVQIVERSVFAALPAGEPMNTIGGVYDGLIRDQPGSVRAFRCDAAFWDVGTAGDYLRTSQAFAAGRPSVGRDAHVDASATIDGSVLWDDVEIGARASVRDCVVTDRVRVPPGARYSRAILIERDGAVAAAPIES
jgi:NDP-sugar pyrophosphorylase family protein